MGEDTDTRSQFDLDAEEREQNFWDQFTREELVDMIGDLERGGLLAQAHIAKLEKVVDAAREIERFQYMTVKLDVSIIGLQEALADLDTP